MPLVRRFAVALLVCGLAAVLTTLPVRAQGHGVVLVTHINGVLGPAAAGAIEDAVTAAAHAQATCLVIVLNSPGGAEEPMRRSISAITRSTIPVVVEVAAGGRADSSAFLVAESASLISVAPTGTVGATHPLRLSGAGDGLPPDLAIQSSAAQLVSALATRNHRSLTWPSVAVERGEQMDGIHAARTAIADDGSADLNGLLTAIDGKTTAQGVVLTTRGVPLETVDPSAWASFIAAVGTPDAAYVVLIIAVGLLGLWFAHPAGIIAVVGALAAGLVAGAAFGNIPINVAGVILLVLAFVLFIVDLRATTHGVLTAAGSVAMAVGGAQLVDTSSLDSGVNPLLVALTVVAIAGAYSLLIPKLVAVRRLPFSDLATQLVGQVGTVREELQPSRRPEDHEPVGMVFLHGTLWRARSTSGLLLVGHSVRVTEVEGLKLTVEPLPEGKTSNAAER